MRVVLDTNVLVAGLLTPNGTPGRVVDLFLSGALTLLVDDRILAEYREVLARPKFGLDSRDVATLLDLVEAEGVRIAAAPSGVPLADATDLPFLEVEMSGGAETLVTGNGRHFAPARRLGATIESPADFVRRWREENG